MPFLIFHFQVCMHEMRMLNILLYIPLSLHLRLHGSSCSHTICMVELVDVGSDPKNTMSYELQTIAFHKTCHFDMFFATYTDLPQISAW